MCICQVFRANFLKNHRSRRASKCLSGGFAGAVFKRLESFRHHRYLNAKKVESYCKIYYFLQLYTLNAGIAFQSVYYTNIRH